MKMDEKLAGIANTAEKEFKEGDFEMELRDHENFLNETGEKIQKIEEKIEEVCAEDKE